MFIALVNIYLKLNLEVLNNDVFLRDRHGCPVELSVNGSKVDNVSGVVSYTNMTKVRSYTAIALLCRCIDYISAASQCSITSF